MKVVIIEDDPFYGEVMEYNLSLNPELEVMRFLTAGDFFKKVDTPPDLISLDYSLPDMSGEAVLSKIKKTMPEVPVIIISGQEDLKTAIQLLKDGAYDYITKDEDAKDRIWNIIKNIKEKIHLKLEIDDLKSQINQKFDLSKTIIGNSSAIKAIFNMVQKAANSNITVSITGETGTGKEVVAKAIHHNSKFKNKQFVGVNITAIPKDLIESELFGHEKGAFTGAIGRRIGKFEEANGGTIFLDEIAEMDINMQSKLLRVLQEKEVTRVGGNNVVKLNCRVIVATHKDMQEEVRKGNFREDLYYRLLGLPIVLPPLRLRGNDIILLAKHFISEYCKENAVSKITLSTSSQNKILKYDWPGNVRELKAVMELGCVMSDNNSIEPDQIIFNQNYSMENILGKELALKEYTNKIIKQFLLKYNNDVVLVSKKLKVGKSTIYRMLQHNVL